MIKILLIAITLASILFVVVDAKLEKKQKIPTDTKKMKEKPAATKQSRSRHSQYLDDDEQISCQCTCAALQQRKNEIKKAEKGSKSIQQCKGKKCKNVPKIQSLKTVQQTIEVSNSKKQRREARSQRPSQTSHKADKKSTKRRNEEL